MYEAVFLLFHCIFQDKLSPTYIHHLKWKNMTTYDKTFLKKHSY